MIELDVSPEDMEYAIEQLGDNESVNFAELFLNVISNKLSKQLDKPFELKSLTIYGNGELEVDIDYIEYRSDNNES